MANAKAAAAAAALKQRQESGGAKTVGILDPLPDAGPDLDDADAGVPGGETPASQPEPELPEPAGAGEPDDDDDADAEDGEDVVVPPPMLITHPVIAPEPLPEPVIDRVGFAPVEAAATPTALTYPEQPPSPTWPRGPGDLSRETILEDLDYEIPPEKDTVARPAVPPAPPAAPVELVDVDAQSVAAAVGPLHKRVFGDVGDEVVKAALRDGVQAIRQAVAVAQARGMMPRKTLSMVVVIDTELNGNAQVFAGDMTIR